MRIAVCDDELSQIQILCGYIDALIPKYPDYAIQYDVYREPEELISYYKRTEKPGYYDIIYLDVEMGDANGVNAALKIREYDRTGLIVYITNYAKYIYGAANTDMFRYLIKPVAKDDFNAVFEDAFKTLDAKGKTFSFTYNYNHYRVYVKDIIYFEILGRKMVMHTTTETHSFWHQLWQVHEELKDYGFVLVHNAILVNMAYVHEVKRTHLTLHDGTAIPISPSRSKIVKSLFAQYEYGRCCL